MCYDVIERSYGKILKEEKKANLKNKLTKLKSSTKKKYLESHSNWSHTLRDHKDFFDYEFEVQPEYFQESND